MRTISLKKDTMVLENLISFSFDRIQLIYVFYSVINLKHYKNLQFKIKAAKILRIRSFLVI